MSIEALSMVLNHSTAMGSAKVILLGIANHLGPDATEGAWPSQKRLADYANLSERGVQKCVDKLVKAGELRVEVAAGHSRNQYKPNRYWITIECPDDCDKSMSHRRGELQEQGRTPVPSGVNHSTGRGVPEFVQTVIEPKEKSKYATSIPDNFTPSASIQETFESKYGEVLNYEETLEAFIDHHLAKGSRFKDWDAAFRNWCRNAKKFAEPRTVIHKQEVKPPAEIPERRAWVKALHDQGEHWECRAGEFGCK